MPAAGITVTRLRLLKRQLEDDREKLRKVVLERNTCKRKLHQLQFVLSLVSPMHIVMSFRCVLRKRLGKDLKMLISYPVEKLVRKERKMRRILYMSILCVEVSTENCSEEN